MLDDSRRLAALVARGGGKTTAGGVRYLVRMMTAWCRCLYVATTRPQAEELLWEPLKQIVARLGLGGEVTWNETKLRLTFRRNGATLRLVGADDKREIEKLRGQPFHEVGIDESASHAPTLLKRLIENCVGPRLGDYGGTLWMEGTPGHVLAGLFYDVTRPGSPLAREPDDETKNRLLWAVHRWSVLDGAPFVPTLARIWEEALIEKEAQGWSDDHPTWKREYLGIWAADDTENVYKYSKHRDGQPWNVWSPERRTNGLASLPEGHEWHFVYGVDMGHGDPLALEVFAYAATSTKLYHVYEHVETGMYARSIAKLLIGEGLDADSPGGLIAETGWPTGAVADMAGLGGAVCAELAEVYGVLLEPAEKKNKHDAIELFNGDLVDGRIFILEGSQLEEQLLNLQWVVDDNGKLAENKAQANHCTDAAVYARRKAMHLLGREPGPPPPAAGTREAIEAAILEQEETRARTNEELEYQPLDPEPWDGW